MPDSSLPAPQTVKKPWQSKTVWVNIVLAVAALFPQVQAFLGQHPEVFMFVFAAVNLLLRLVTKDQISISDS